MYLMRSWVVARRQTIETNYQKQTVKDLFTVFKEIKAKLRFQQGTIIAYKQWNKFENEPHRNSRIENSTMKWKNQSVQFSCSVLSKSLWPHGLQHARVPCPSPAPWAWSSSCSSNWWCHPSMASSVVPFSSCLQSFPASGFFLMS